MDQPIGLALQSPQLRLASESIGKLSEFAKEAGVETRGDLSDLEPEQIEEAASLLKKGPERKRFEREVEGIRRSMSGQSDAPPPTSPTRARHAPLPPGLQPATLAKQLRAE